MSHSSASRSVVVGGVDPGSRFVAWAVLVVARKSTFLACSTLDLQQFGERDVVRTVRERMRYYGAQRVGVERVGQVNCRPGFGAKMATDLVASNGIGQRIAQGLEDDGLPVDEFAAEAWHMHFFDARAVKPAAVKALIEQRVVGWGTRSDVHQRDAGACALFTASRRTA